MANQAGNPLKSETIDKAMLLR